MYTRETRGFTLIELLVVIAIIGILASVVLVNLNTARKKARDTKRLADFEEVSKALELYYLEYRDYPTYNNGNCCSGDHQEKFRRMTQDLVDEGFLGSVPTPPSSGSGYNYYDYGPGSSAGGIIVTSLEAIDSTTEPPYGSCRPFDNNWCSATQSSRNYCICHTH